MIRDEDGLLTGYVYLDLATKDYGGFVTKADRLLREKLKLPPGYTYKWSGEYEFELRAKSTPEDHRAYRVLCNFLAPLHGISFRNGSCRPHLSYVLCHDRRTHPPVVARLQFQRCRLGRLHCPVRNRRGNRRRHGRLSPRIARQAPRYRHSRSSTKTSRQRPSKEPYSVCVQN